MINLQNERKSRLFKNPWPPEFFFPNCNCCDTPFGCPFCVDGIASENWEFTVAGVINDANCEASGNCDLFNRTHALTPSGQCLWVSPIYDTGCSLHTGVYRFIFSVNVLGSMNLQLKDTSTTATLVSWRLAAPVDCVGSNILTINSIGVCTGWPTTITVSPV